MPLSFKVGIPGTENLIKAVNISVHPGFNNLWPEGQDYVIQMWLQGPIPVYDCRVGRGAIPGKEGFVESQAGPKRYLLTW